MRSKIQFLRSHHIGGFCFFSSIFDEYGIKNNVTVIIILRVKYFSSFDTFCFCARVRFDSRQDFEACALES
jgi:hypothetical protein